MKITQFLIASSLLLFLTVAATASATSEEEPIYPLWQHLDQNGKRQFVEGYIAGFRDARVLGEIALEYAKVNPITVQKGLKDILTHYRLTPLGANQLVPLLDEHLSDQKNREQSLRMAINAVQR